MAFLQDQELLLSKVEIGKKIEQLLAGVEKNLFSIIAQYSWPAEVLVRSGKISKGENYRGLPYFMLDYPRHFAKDDVFAFRTMFWWGNFFSATLHLGGQYLDKRRAALINNLEAIRSSEVFVCVNRNPWEYHYGEDNYILAGRHERDQLKSLLETKAFVKISYRWELNDYHSLPMLVSESFTQTISWTIG